MSNDDLPRYYWDACVFLSYVEEQENRLPDIDSFLTQAKKGEIEIVTSTLSMVEVAYAPIERTGEQLEPQEERQIEKLWRPDSPVTLVEFHPLIAYDAKRLIRLGLPRGWSLKPNDAIHLATAERMSVDAVHTYDSALGKYGELIGRPVEKPESDQPSLL